jgi:hypothetical protein
MKTAQEDRMGLEITFFAGAFVLLTALIYGTLQYRYRNRAAARAGAEIARDRYKRDQA